MRINSLSQPKPGFAARRIGLATLALAGAAAIATPAWAQDEFSGFRVEVVGGYDNEGVDFDDDVFDGGKRDTSGFAIGVGGGYDFQMNQLVLGVEGEFTESTADHNQSETGNRPTQPIATPITANYDLNSGGDIYVGGRAGYVVSQNVLLYAKAGYSWHKLTIQGQGTDNGVPFTIDESVDLGGLRLGAGGEMNFSEHFYGKAEYRYSNYNNGDLNVRGATASLDPVFAGIDDVRHQVMFGAGFRF